MAVHVQASVVMRKKNLKKKMLEEELEKIPNEVVREKARKYIHNIDAGERF